MNRSPLTRLKNIIETLLKPNNITTIKLKIEVKIINVSKREFNFNYRVCSYY